jgi:hypothetical protein
MYTRKKLNFEQIILSKTTSPKHMDLRKCEVKSSKQHTLTPVSQFMIHIKIKLDSIFNLAFLLFNQTIRHIKVHFRIALVPKLHTQQNYIYSLIRDSLVSIEICDRVVNINRNLF